MNTMMNHSHFKKTFSILVILSILMTVLLVGCEKQNTRSTTDQPPALPTGDTEQPPAFPTDVQENPTSSNNDCGYFMIDCNKSTNTVKNTSPDQPPLLPSDLSQPGLTSTTTSKEFVGVWRQFSSRMFYDSGGGGALGTPSGVSLELTSDGIWKFSSSTGKWHVETIQDADWKKWGSEPYGPTRKMVLDGWNKDVADGPIEESNGNVDFFWVMYRVGPPTVGSPGQVQVKYGHAS